MDIIVLRCHLRGGKGSIVTALLASACYCTLGKLASLQGKPTVFPDISLVVVIVARIGSKRNKYR